MLYRVNAKEIGTAVELLLRVEFVVLFSVILLFVLEFHGCPRTAEYVDTLGEDVVVYESGVYRETAHQKNNVSPVEECQPNLVCRLLLNEIALLENHPQSEQCHNQAVAGVAEHHREQEREGDYGEGGRVHLPIGGHSVRVHYVLEAAGHWWKTEE